MKTVTRPDLVPAIAGSKPIRLSLPLSPALSAAAEDVTRAVRRVALAHAAF